MINVALDAVWNGESAWAKEEAEHILAFFEDKREDGSWKTVYTTDGEPTEEKALHPVGLTASNASAAVLAPEAAKPWVELFLKGGLRKGDRRYYDNCLYFFVYMLLSGNYRMY